MDVLECLKNIVGLSLSECECLPENGDIDVETSLSGIYLDNLEYSIPLQLPQRAAECGDVNIWELMDQARCEAIKDVITHFQISIPSSKKPVFSSYAGEIGYKSKKGNSRLTGLREFTGIYISPKAKFKGVTLCLSEIELCINRADDYFVHIFEVDGEDLNLICTEMVTVTQSGNSISGKITTDKTLPLYDNKGRRKCYYIGYDRKGADPKNFKFHCGCASVPLPNWMQDRHLEIGGFDTDNIDTLSSKRCDSKYSNGLVICFNLQCDLFGWLCDVKPDFWKYDPFGSVFAQAVMLKANAKLAQKILNSESPSFYTLLGREGLYGKRNHFRKLSDDLMTLMATKYFPSQMDHCFICDPSKSGGFSKSSIIS